MMPSMPSKGMSDMSDSKDMEEEDDGTSSKLLALQNLIGAIGELAGDEMKPYIEKMQQQMHMEHESAEGDQMGVDNEEEHEGMEGEDKPALDVAIGVGKPGMEDKDQPKGFLGILAKKMKK